MRNVFIFQIALRILASNLFDSVDEQNLSTPVRAFFCAADDNAGFHRRIEEQIRAKADDAFDQIALY